MGPRTSLACLLALASGSIANGQAVAQAIEPGREGALGELVAPVPDRSACFARRYDAGHLKAHPAQKVTRMALRITYHRHEPDGSYPQGQRNYYFTLSASLRGRKAALVSSGECGLRNGEIVCTVECDGGGFGLKREASAGVLLDLTRYGRLRLSRGCDEGESVELTPGQDDRRFRLPVAAAGECAE